MLNKLRFQALIVRPKSLFSKCFVEVPVGESKPFYRMYRRYLRLTDSTIYVLDADKLWMERYNQISFPVFKARLATGKIFRNFHVELRNKVTLRLHDSVNKILSEIEVFFNFAHRFLNEMQRTGHRISVDKMKSMLPFGYDAIKKDQFIETFRLLYATNHGLGGDTAAYCRVYKMSDGTESFQLIQSGYDNTRQLYRSSFTSIVKSEEICMYCATKDPIVKVSEFLNSLGIADYCRQGGDQPAIFIRINNPYYLNSMIRGGRYHNRILENIYEKYNYSERIFTYFFTTKMTNEQRWDFIEAYFLGESEEKLLNFVQA